MQGVTWPKGGGNRDKKEKAGMAESAGMRSGSKRVSDEAIDLT